MSLVDEARALDFTRQYVAYRPPQTFAVANSPFNLFTIVGGPCLVHGIFCYCPTAAMAAASTFALVVCGAIIDGGAANSNTAVGGTFMYRLDVAGGGAVAAVSNPMPTLLGAAAGAYGALVCPGGANGDNFVLAVAANNVVANVSWYVVFRKLNIWSDII